MPDFSPPSPPPPPSAQPLLTLLAVHIPRNILRSMFMSVRGELAAVMDVVCSLATTQASLDQRLAQAEATIEHSHAMLLRIMSHLGLPPVPTH